MGDEEFIFKEKFDRPVERSSTLVKILTNEQKPNQNSKHLKQQRYQKQHYP